MARYWRSAWPARRWCVASWQCSRRRGKRRSTGPRFVMAQPRVLILRAPGTNCDAETAYAFELAGGRPERLHVNRLLESPGQIAGFQILCLPGGFSYGDDIAAGRILGNQIRHHLADWL